MQHFRVPKLHCDACVGRVTRAVASVDPNASVTADIAAREISVETLADAADIQAVLEKAGYPASPQDQR